MIQPTYPVSSTGGLTSEWWRERQWVQGSLNPTLHAISLHHPLRWLTPSMSVGLYPQPPAACLEQQQRETVGSQSNWQGGRVGGETVGERKEEEGDEVDDRLWIFFWFWCVSDWGNGWNLLLIQIKWEIIMKRTMELSFQWKTCINLYRNTHCAQKYVDTPWSS